ncbi:ParB/RepB/Spo0J family partition protein [Niveispirillum sp. KHB5.9]|uniref:ParB/RepB/Spo0J family partition protein n=1 Tax=Niveispirillum sp. KHB5.9 TaxID=3400269 RepID=UPI003A8B2696
MTTTIIRDIPLSKLVPCDRNVRRTGGGAGLEELAASIAAHGLLQSLNVRPDLDAEGNETGKYQVCGGGRRLAALKLLVKRKQVARAAPVPCLISEGDAQEISLAENVVRENLHPADQFEAFRRLSEEGGLGAEDIAARFGVTAQVVRQRLRLGAVSPRLLAIYREGGLRLDQLMAFAITDSHERQEQVYDGLSWNKEPHIIRRALTEAHVPAGDRRARFVGVEAYETAGGTILRDLFSEDEGGYFEDAALLDRLVLDKLEAVAGGMRAEGWKWVQPFIDFPYALGLRREYPQVVDLSPTDQRQLDALQDEQDALSLAHEGLEELPADVEARLAELDGEIDRLAARQQAYDPDTIARGGVFVVLGHDGQARIERGFIRPEDEKPAEPEPAAVSEENEAVSHSGDGRTEAASAPDGEDEDMGEGRPLSDLLVRDLTAHRTLGLRLALGKHPDIAVIALTHALVSSLFAIETDGTCLDIRAHSTPLSGHADRIDDTAAAQALARRHEDWAVQLPRHSVGLWVFLVGLDAEQRSRLLAHCVALTAFAVRQPWERRPQALAMADRLAQATHLDMTVYWAPTVRTYLGRVTKAQILSAVREAVSDEAAQRMEGMKKQPMAEAAQQLLTGAGWLPMLLRMPDEEPAANRTETPYAQAAE